MRKNLEKTLRTYNVNMNVDLALDTTDLIISSVKKNLGIGYVVKKSVENELKNGEIKELKIDCNLPKLELNLAYINDYLSPSARKFLKEYIKAI